MAVSPDLQAEVDAAEQAIDAIEYKIKCKQAEHDNATDKADRAKLRLELQSTERQKAAAQRKLKVAQVKLRKAEGTEVMAQKPPMSDEHPCVAAVGVAATAQPHTVLAGSDANVTCGPAVVAEQSPPWPAVVEDEWVEHVDAQSGSMFYFNARTGESSWTKPQSDAAPAQQVAGASVVAAAEQPLATPAIVEDEWMEHVDAQSGNTFYFNARTGESSWTKPQSEAASQEPVAEQVVEQVAEQVWTEHADPVTGNIFYFNTQTGESAWSLPEQEAVQQFETPAALGAAEEWTENIEPTSGQKFYYNLVTQESSWTLPSEARLVQPTGAVAA